MKETILELFCLARNRDALVADLMIAHNDVLHWNINILDWCMIGRWTLFLLFSMFCIPLSWVREVKISFGLLQKDDLLR